MEERLTRALFRVNCPDPIELGEYKLKMVSRERVSFIKQHLAECPLCAREMFQLKEYLARVRSDIELDALTRARERVKVIVARLLPAPETKHRTGLGEPAFAGLRGSEEGPLIYQAGDIELAIEVSAESERPEQMMIAGLITGLKDPDTAMVHLWQAGEHVRTIQVSELGNFEIAELLPGSYELMVGDSEIEIHIQDLPLGTG